MAEKNFLHFGADKMRSIWYNMSTGVANPNDFLYPYYKEGKEKMNDSW